MPGCGRRWTRELSERAAAWGVLSADKLDKAIEVWIDKYDPDAVRRLAREAAGAFVHDR